MHGDVGDEVTESLIEQLDEALCTLLHDGGETGEHSPRTHLDLFYACQSGEPLSDDLGKALVQVIEAGIQS